MNTDIRYIYRAFIANKPIQGLLVAEDVDEGRCLAEGLWMADKLFPNFEFMPSDISVIRSVDDGVQRVIGKYRIGS